MGTDLVALPPSVAARHLDIAQWNTLCNSLFPGAKPDSVLLAVDYCKARGLDVMKKPCHIVPMQVKQGGEYVWRDVVMPGIYELRTTAMRSGLYLGHSEITYGPEVDYNGLLVPAWAQMTVYRWNDRAARVIEFPQRVLFSEVVNTNREGKPTQRWQKAPIQMMDKCLEAAALRKAFPDEFGGIHTDDEMEGRVIDGELGHGASTVAHDGSRAGARGVRHRNAKPAVAEPRPVEAARRDEGAAGGASADVRPNGRESAQGQQGAPGADQGGNPADDADDCITSAQATLLRKRLKDANLSEAALCTAFQIANVELLSFEKVEDAKDWIANGGK